MGQSSAGILCTGSVFIEAKLIHSGGLVGHVEDVVVDRLVRRKGLGKHLVGELIRIARGAGCYKVILNCASGNQSFYEACGFKWKSVMMVQYFKEVTPMFDVKRIEQSARSRELADGLLVRQLRKADYDSDVLLLLAQLTTVGTVSHELFEARVDMLNSLHHIFVLEEQQTSRVVGIGTVLVEPKFIHEAGFAGHIEDVVVDSSGRGRGWGKLLIQHLVQVAEAAGCYKVILDCGEKTVRFYQKCDFWQKEVQ